MRQSEPKAKTNQGKRLQVSRKKKHKETIAIIGLVIHSTRVTGLVLHVQADWIELACEDVGNALLRLCHLARASVSVLQFRRYMERRNRGDSLVKAQCD